MTTTKNSTNKPKRGAKKVTCKNFNAKNFFTTEDRTIREASFKGKSENEQKPSQQYTAFPKYIYGKSSGENNSKAEPEKDTFSLLTDVMEMRKGGLLSVDGTYRKTDDDCTAFWLPLEKDFGGEAAETLNKILSEIDDKIGGKIEKDPSNFLIVKNGNNEKPVDNLVYTPLVREAQAPDGVKDFKPWVRTKVRIPFKDVEDEDGKHREIEVKLVLPEEDEEGDRVKKVVRSIQELRDDFTYGCKAQFLLEIKTFWALKTAKKVGKTVVRDCGFKVTCKMINIVERSKSQKQRDLDLDDIFDLDGEEEDGFSKPVKKVPQKEDSSDDDSDNSVSDNVDAKNAKTAASSDDDSDDSDGSDDSDDSDEEIQKKPTKKPNPKEKNLKK